MKQKDFLIILTILFSFTASWIGFNIYHSARSSTISKTTNQDITPIAPAFDTEKINKLKQRQLINPAFELENIVPTPQNASAEAKLAI